MAHNIDDTDTQGTEPIICTIAPHFYQRLWFWPLCAALVGLVIWSGYRRRVRRIQENLQTILTERSRIARELHDTLLQGFSGVTMEMQALATRLPVSGERAALDEIIRDAGHCMREARRSVAGLRTAPGARSGLAVSLAMAARQLTEGKDLRLKLELTATLPALPSEVEYNLLRIALEAITNSVKHSGGRTVAVAMKTTDTALQLSVHDDGVGFVTHPSGGWLGHYGLIGMRERASQIGAEFFLETQPHAGTTVRVHFPRAHDLKSPDV